MLRGLSQNKPEVPGKRANAQTLHGKATHFTLGDDTLKGFKTTNQDAFIGRQGQKSEQAQSAKPHKSQVELGTEKLDYKSQTQASIVGMPPGFVKARPLRERQELVKTNYSVSPVILITTAW